MKKHPPAKALSSKQIKNPKPAETTVQDKGFYKSTSFWLKITLFIFAFVLYGNTMKNGYSLDDLYVTYNNPMVKKGIQALPLIFSSRYINMNAEEGGSMNFGYRPLTKAMFAIERQLFGESPSTSHLINIILYGLTLILLFALLRRLMVKYPVWFPFLIVLLWAAHPLHTEVVASLKNREEIISFLFGLLALKSYMDFERKNSFGYLVIGGIWFLLSIFSKLSTIPLLAAIPFAIYFFTGANLKKIGLITGSMLLACLFALLFVKIFLPAINRPMLFFENPLAFEKNFLLHVSTGMFGLLMYLKLLVFPHPLLFYYGYNTLPVVNFADIWVILSIVVHLALLGYAVMKFREKHILSFAIFFYFIIISMYSNFVKPPAGIIAERFLYIASIGFCLAIAWAIFRLLKVPLDKPMANKQVLKVILVSMVLIIPYTARTVLRNRDWNSQLSLFSHDIQYLGNSAKANYIYATTLKTDLIEKIGDNGNRSGTEGQVQQIIRLLEQAVKVYPGYFEAWNSLGEMYAMMKTDYDKALDYFKKSTEVRPKYAAAWFNLGYAYQQKEDFPKAIENYQKAFELDTTDVKAASNLAYCLNKNGQADKALALNKRIVSLSPKMEMPYMNIAMYYYRQGDTLNALKWMESLVRAKPGAKRACNMLTRYYSGKGDSIKASYYMEMANRNKEKE